jgi:hypothetical protein
LRTTASRNAERTALAAAVLLALLLELRAHCAEIEGVIFEDRVLAHDVPLVVAHVGLLRWKVVFRGYVAALYLAEGSSPDAWSSDVPKRLELVYFWPIAGKAFGRTGEEILARNVSSQEIAGLRTRLDRIASLYPDVRAGDRLSLTYVPGVGSELAWNGNVLGELEGADFAAAYFAIWLGREPMSAPLRDQLLGRR